MGELERVNLGPFFGTGCFVNLLYTTPSSFVNRTELNLLCGNDIALHCNARYDERTLVLNSRVNNQWQYEDRPPNFPIIVNQTAQIVAAINDQTIDLYGNKDQFCYSYRHRYDVTKVNQVSCTAPGTNKPGTPMLVWVGKALPNFEVGKVVYITAVAPTSGTFRFQLVPSLPHQLNRNYAAFIMEPRFHENCVVRNHMAEGRFGHEEREGGFPFAAGQRFIMTIIAQKHGFEVGVNGRHLCYFNYRVPLTKDMSIQLQAVPTIENIEYR